MELPWNIECSRARRIAYTLSADKYEGGGVISNKILRKYFGTTFIRLILFKPRIIRSFYEHDNELSNYTHFT